MIRTLPLLAAALSSALLLGATAASAQAPAGHYVAVPAAAPAKARLMTRETPWALRDGAYVAARAPSRDGVVCQLVAREVGPLSSFSAGGKPLDADALAKCNSKAGGAVAQVTAAN